MPNVCSDLPICTHAFGKGVTRCCVNDRMIYHSRNYIIHTHYKYIVHADVIECADASDYTCILLHVQHPSPFERNKTKQKKQERKIYTK